MQSTATLCLRHIHTNPLNYIATLQVWELTVGGAGQYCSYGYTYHITMLEANLDPIVTLISSGSYLDNVVLQAGACAAPNCGGEASMYLNIRSQTNANVGAHYVQVTMRKIADFSLYGT